jgi:hypothetical protein
MPASYVATERLTYQVVCTDGAKRIAQVHRQMAIGKGRCGHPSGFLRHGV